MNTPTCPVCGKPIETIMGADRDYTFHKDSTPLCVFASCTTPPTPTPERDGVTEDVTPEVFEGWRNEWNNIPDDPGEPTYAEFMAAKIAAHTRAAVKRETLTLKGAIKFYEQQSAEDGLKIARLTAELAKAKLYSDATTKAINELWKLLENAGFIPTNNGWLAESRKALEQHASLTAEVAALRADRVEKP